MSTEIKYTNSFCFPITEQQAQQTKDYDIVYEEDGIVKKTVEIRDNKEDWVSYYKSPEEQEEEILLMLRTEHPLLETFSIREIEIYGSYSIINERRHRFTGNAYSPLRFRWVEDSLGNVISSENIDAIEGLMGNHLDYELRHKYFYSEEVYNGYCIGAVEIGLEDPRFLVFRVDYNPDGTLDGATLNLNSTYNKESYTAENWDDLVNICNLSPAMGAWYASSEFLPPLD